jgi:ankyrin repeat protein
MNIFFSPKQLSLVKYMVEQDQSVLNLANYYNNTALHSAVLAGNLEVVKFLIDSAKAKIEPGFEGHTLLTEALIMGHNKILHYLLEKQVMNVSAKTSMGQTLLHFATFQNETDLVKKLVRKYHANPGIADDSNIVPLVLAAHKGNLELVDFFFEKGSYCTSALLAATASEGHLHIIEYLIKKQKLPIEVRVLEDKTMLDIAITKGYQDIIKFLLQIGEEKFDIEGIIFNSIDNIHALENARYIGINTFDFAPVEGDDLFSEFIFGSLDKRQIMDELLFIMNNSALIRSEENTHNGLNVLHYAAKRGNLPVIKEIIERNLIQV